MDDRFCPSPQKANGRKWIRRARLHTYNSDVSAAFRLSLASSLLSRRQSMRQCKKQILAKLDLERARSIILHAIGVHSCTWKRP